MKNKHFTICKKCKRKTFFLFCFSCGYKFMEPPKNESKRRN